MDFYNDKHFLFLLLAFALFAVGIVFFAGWLLIVAMVFFGIILLSWRQPHIKISGMVFLVLLALINIYAHGMNFGIDFVGGTRIPVVLEHSVDQTTMNEMVDTIKSRASTLGLKEVKVRAVGDSLINVEVASSDEETISYIENTLTQQGVYLGIIDGEIAVDGDHIFRSSIASLSSNELIQQGADWGVSFSVDKEGGEMFAAAAKGKADYPIYMFIDRPGDAALFYDEEMFETYIISDSGQKETLNALEDMLKLEGSNIPVYIIQEMPENLTPTINNTKALISENLPDEIKDNLTAMGFTLVEYSEEKMAPNFTRTATGVLVVSKLEAVGLLTAPHLSSGVTTGIPLYNYVITGSVQATDTKSASQEAAEKVKSIESILKGGALPVQISLGSRTTLPAALGSQFLQLSLLAIGSSLVAISILIGLRYRNIKATLPIILISLAELAILLSILGSFTIDLAAMAGIIAAIGVGVDAQIVITDELLKKDDHKVSEKIDLAFGIIKTNAIVAIFSMIPLMFSGLVEIIGFAMSTMLGALLGYLLTRPAYAAIVEKVLDAEKKGEEHRHGHPIA
jgi:preprotein translocase subunit SecD